MVSGRLKQSIACSSPSQIDAFSLSAWRLADNRATDLTKEGMLKGIEQAAAFVLFLSQGVLQRPYCQMEIRHALALKKPIVLLHESDARYGGFDFRSAHEKAPADLQELLDEHESLVGARTARPIRSLSLSFTLSLSAVSKAWLCCGP